MPPSLTLIRCIACCLFCLLFSSSGCSDLSEGGAAGTAITSYVIAHTSEPPTLDGKLNDATWQAASSTEFFVIHDTGAPAPINTQAKLLYDNNYLYIGFSLVDKDIYAHFTRHREPLFSRDDVLEIFIDPSGAARHYLELGISASAYTYALIIPKAVGHRMKSQQTPLAELTAATHIEGSLNDPDHPDTGWSAEIRIPLASIQQDIRRADGTNLSLPIEPGTRWRMGLFRIDYDHTSSRNKANGYYSWQTVGSFGFHHPQKFGWVEFGKKGLSITH